MLLRAGYVRPRIVNFKTSKKLSLAKESGFLAIILPRAKLLPTRFPDSCFICKHLFHAFFCVVWFLLCVRTRLVHRD